MEFKDEKGFVDISGYLKGGVYLLLWKGTVVYVGQTNAFWRRIYTHASLMNRYLKTGKVPPKMYGIKVMRFDGIRIMALQPSDFHRMERELIAKYRPKYNEKLLPKGELSLTEAGFDWTKLVKGPSLKGAPIRARVECDRRV